MKQYSYETIRLGDNSSTKHREIIEQYAEQGWEFKGFVPVLVNDNGRLRDIDLVFEKNKTRSVYH